MGTNRRQIAQIIRQRQNELAEAIIVCQYERQPEIWKPFGNIGREKSVRDVGYHLSYLAEAIEADAPELFNEYLAWVKILFASLKFPAHVLSATLDCTRQTLITHLPPEMSSVALQILDTGIQALSQASVELPTFLDGDTPLDNMARQFLAALLQADRRAASQMILNAVQQGESIKEIYLCVFQRTQRELGRLWQTNQISVAQEHFCTAATQMIMSQLYPFIFSANDKRKDRRLVATCIGGELHEIGARMVADFFEMEGWDTYFLGANTPPESILRAVKDYRANVLAISATMIFHVSLVTEMIRVLRADSSIRIPVLVGGYPFNLSPGLWRQVGADGYAQDAQSAISAAEGLLQS